MTQASAMSTGRIEVNKPMIGQEKSMKRFLVLLILLCCVAPAGAFEIGGVQLPDSLTAGDTELKLNGAGLRTKLFFKIYAGGLYLPTPSRDAGAIIAADAPMLVRMHFIYDGVSAEKMQKGWQEGFSVTAPEPADDLKQAMKTFSDFFTREVRENDIYDIAWLPGRGLKVSLNGTSLGMVTGLDFKKALFAIWLGRDPVDDDLKEGMLGR
jgi:hypothetical protein